MTLRIHFSQDDFALTSLAHAPDLTWESLLSMHMLQTTVGPVIFGQWRASVRRQLNAAAGQLLRLAPPVGYSPDFLTPTAGEDNPELALTSLKSTSKARLRHDMLELAHSGRRLPPWAPLLASSDREPCPTSPTACPTTSTAPSHRTGLGSEAVSKPRERSMPELWPRVISVAS